MVDIPMDAGGPWVLLPGEADSGPRAGSDELSTKPCQLESCVCVCVCVFVCVCVCVERLNRRKTSTTVIDYF